MDNVTLLTWRMPDRPAKVIETATLPERERPQIVQKARGRLGAQGVWYLATCQRVVWLVHGGDDIASRLIRFYGSRDRRLPSPEQWDRFDAFRHLCEVATSLDAFVPGEPQVLGQVREAVREAEAAGVMDTDLRHVLDQVLRTAKEVRSQTDLFRGKVSLLPLVHRTIAEALVGTRAPTVAVLGTGEMALRCTEAIRQAARGAHIITVSRDADRATAFASKCQGEPAALEQFLTAPPADLRLLVCAMSTESPVLDKAWFQAVTKEAPTMTTIDLGMPRNVAAVSPNVRLIQMDDLGRMAQANRRIRDEALDDAQRILEDAIDRVRQAYDERCHASSLHRLSARFQEVMEQRWVEAHGIDMEDPRTRKWYEQTVRALLHEATQVVKEPAMTTAPPGLLEEPEA